MYDTIAFIKQKQAQGFTGYLHFGMYLLFFDQGFLCSAEMHEDRFWILRRLLCENHITDEYAQDLQDLEDELTLFMFPTITQREWDQLWKDRSRQNLFFILGVDTIPSQVVCSVDKLPFLHQVNLDDMATLYQNIYPLHSRIQHIWVKPNHNDSAIQTKAIPLAALVAQSPWEEIDTLQSMYELIQAGELSWGENIAALEGAILEEEESLFFKEEDHNKQAQFVVSKQFLDHVQLESDPSKDKDR